MFVLDGSTTAQNQFITNYFGEKAFIDEPARLAAAQLLASNALDAPLPDNGHKVHNLMGALWGEERDDLSRIARSLYWWTDKVKVSPDQPLLVMRSGNADEILDAAENGTPLAADIEDEVIKADFGYIADFDGDGQSTFLFKGSEEGDLPRKGFRHPNLWFSLGATVTGLQVVRYNGFADRANVTNQDTDPTRNHLVSVLEGIVPVPEVKADEEYGISLEESFAEAKLLYASRMLASADVYFGNAAMNIIEAIAKVAKRGAPERFTAWQRADQQTLLDLGQVFRDGTTTAARYIPSLILPRPPVVKVS